MSELDKFKRRTIRSVARLLLQEKKPEEELWKQMKKETGTDCRVLWERMRALCIKKLNRMIAVDDRSANLPSIARLSLTDWLLVDLVLVHEEIDVIAMDREESTEYPALIELFNLVQRFDIEGRSGDSLAEAWAAGTVFYNRQGRQCSPMLLQRRWYQLKKLTRCRFYKFWFAYRGNTRLLEEARKCMPTRLQMAIARRYPQMITGQFRDWEELIEKRFVIMPEEFEAKMRMPNLPKPCSSNAPDLVLVEPIIETIDVESEPEDQNDDDMEDNSDPEKSNDATDLKCPHARDSTDETTRDDTMATEEQETVNNEELVTEQNSGTEPIEEDGLSNVQLISATHVPEVEIPDESPDESPELSPDQDDREVNTEDSPMDNNLDEDEDDIIEMPSVVPAVNVDLEVPKDNFLQTVEEASPNNITCEVDDKDEDEIIEMPSVVPAVNVIVEIPKGNVLQTVEEASPNNITCEVETINDSDEGIDDIIKVKADAFCRKATEEVSGERYDTIDDLIKDKVETFLKKPKGDISFIEKNSDVSNINLNKTEVAAIDLMADLNFVDDGIEFVDDGVEFVEDTTHKIDPTKNTRAEQIEEPPEQNKFDLKLLLYPVVYTTKLDQMKTFTDKPFTAVENKEDIEMALNESKPISRQSFSMKIKQESVTSMAEDTTESDDLFANQEASDDEQIDEDAKVSPNSYMLKKPRTRTYDLIKLCKNPDFNTKLKRLTIGFLSSTRNRQLLNACIPMTIDLSKAFETKLVNKTLYLKSSGTSPIVVKQEVTDDKQASSIVPTAMPVQSLINNSKVDIHHLISNQPPEPMVPERTKIIKLPDIEKVRRINQQLLTAEVPPLRVYSGNGHRETPPVPPAPNEVQATKDHTHEANPALSSAPIEPVSTTSINTPPVKVKIEGEKSSTTDTVTTPSETLPPAKQKLLKMINQAKIITQEALAKIDDGIKEDDFPMPIIVNEVKANIPLEAQRKPTTPWYRPREQLAWAPKYTKQPKNLDDFGLLTSDTLNKMLHLLMSGSDGTGCKCCATKSKAKKKTKTETAKPKEPETSKKKQDINSEPVKKDANAPKNPPSDQVPLEGEATKSKEQKAKSKLVVLGRVVKYCCWAKEKICNRRRITKHKCPPGDCKCCCAEELAFKTVQNLQARRDKGKQRKELELKKKDVAIELSDEEDDSLKKACESIDSVVQQSRDGTNNNFGQGEPPAVQSIVIRPVTSTNIVSPTSSSVKVSVAVGTDPSEFPSVMPTTPPKAPFIQTIRAASMASLMPKKPPAPRVNVIPQPQTVQSQTWVPAVSQDFRRSIVIDASVSHPRHPKPITPTTPVAPTPIAPKVPVPNLTPIASKSEKVLYLHSKSIAKSPSESPIFLGKNKILLTTVKFPRKDEDVPAAEVVAPKIIPTLPLPAGVQLVLLPSGNVTYTLDPGVELDEAQLATLPTILAAVQEQINSSGPVISSGMAEPQINITGEVQPVTALPPEMSVPENTTPLPSGETIEMPQTVGSITETIETSPITLTTDEVIQDPELPAKNANVVDMEVNTDSTNVDASAAQETATNVAEEVIVNSEDTVNEVTVDSEAPSEDTVNEVTVDSEAPSENTVNEVTVDSETPSENTVNEVTVDSEAAKDNTELAEDSQVEKTKITGRGEDLSDNRKSLLSDLMEMSGISAEDTIAPEPVVSQPVTELQNTASTTGNDELRNLPELSPVTSFAELKYACEQNGKFFKLDFETGVIVPINVCIKKNTKNKPLVTKECIDLTDDGDTDVAISTAQDTQETALSQDSQRIGPVEYLYKGQTVTVPAVKPVKLFKAFRPTPNVLRVTRHVKSRGDSPISMNAQTHVQKRKQSLLKARVEARIDLVDSEEEPMEEEYLVDSSDDEPTTDSMQVEALDPFTQSDDSSDDEPLAKKSKRLKEVEDIENIRETNIYDDVPADPNELALKDVASVIDTQREKVLLNSTLPEAPLLTAVVPSISVSVRSESDIASPIQKNNSPSKVTVPSDVPVDYEMFPDESDDEELDKNRSEIRFMSDPSDGEGGDDCILGV